MISEDSPRIRAVPTVIVGAVGGLLVGIGSVGSGSLIMVALLLIYPTLSAVRLGQHRRAAAYPAEPRRHSKHLPRRTRWRAG